MHFTLFRSGKKSNLFWIFFLFRLCKCYKKTIFTKSTLCKALVVIMQSIYFFIKIFFRHFISNNIIQLKIYYRWDNLVALFYKSGAKCTLLSKKWWMQWIDITNHYQFGHFFRPQWSTSIFFFSWNYHLVFRNNQK